jgi:hypothetical protein
MRGEPGKTCFAFLVIMMLGALPLQALAQDALFSIRGSVGPAYFPLTRTQDFIRKYANGNGEFRGARTTLTGGIAMTYGLTPDLSLVLGAEFAEIDQEYLVTPGKPTWGKATWHFRSIPVTAMIEYSFKEKILGMTPFLGGGISCVFAGLHQSSDFAAVDGERAAVQFLNQQDNSYGLNAVASGGVCVDLGPNFGIIAETRYAHAMVLPGLQVYEVRWAANLAEMPVDLSEVSVSMSVVWKF